MTTYVHHKSCKHGHPPIRYISTNTCCKCISEGRDRRRADPAKRKKEYNRTVELRRLNYPAQRAARLAANNQWKKDNAEWIRNYNLQRLAKIKGAEGSFTQADVLVILDEQGNKCPGCLHSFSEELKYTIDHFIPIALGGSNYPENLQLLCKSCNCSKGCKLWKEWRRD